VGLKAHLTVSIALMFGGFFGGAILHMWLYRQGGALQEILFFVLPLAGAYLLPLAFARLAPAACPKCGGRAAAEPKNPLIYACRDCSAKFNGAEILLAEKAEEALAPGQVAARGTRSSFRQMPWLLLVIGLVAVGVSVYLAGDSLRLVRDGVSTEARVVKVSMRLDRDKEGKQVRVYTAAIQYQAGAAPFTIDRSWSVGENGSCLWPCYKQGENLKVIYLPADPASARIHSLSELFFAPGMFGLVGLVFVLVSVIFLRKRPS